MSAFNPSLHQPPHPHSDEVSTGAPAIEVWPLGFWGDGGVYFGVWLVNILLTLITLGLYTPWARRRTIRYFYGHTEAANSMLEFTAGIRNMVIGFALLVLFYGLLNFTPPAGYEWIALALLTLAVLAMPFLWGNAVRFRLANTRWRGLQPRFVANWKEVYAASWPLLALAAVWLLAGWALATHLGSEPLPSLDLGPGSQSAAASGTATAPAAPASSGLRKPLSTSSVLLGVGTVTVAMLLSALALLRLQFNYQRLQFTRTLLGTQAGRFKPVFDDFLRIALATAGVALLGVLVLLALVFGAIAILGGLKGLWPTALMSLEGSPDKRWVLLGVLAGFAAPFVLLLALWPALAYREARMFQLIWGGTGLSQSARLTSALNVGAFVRLRLKNMLLMLLTMGFYRPFARVAEYKMKVESLKLHVKGGLDQWVSVLAAQQSGGFADAMADAVGLDFGG